MFDESVHPGVAAAVSMRPILQDLEPLLDGDELSSEAAARIVTALAESYIAGLVDGARDTVAQIAVEVAERGLHLRLGPELLAGDEPELSGEAEG